VICAREANLHALTVEPRIARPGETVRLVVRIPNLGATPSPAATVRFVLDDALEPLDETAVAVASTPPGEALLATLAVRVAERSSDGAELAAQALVEVDEATLATNVRTVAIRCRASVGGPESGVWVEAVDTDRLRVRAVVVNDGDGAARDLRVTIPAPFGSAYRDEADGCATIEHLAAGARESVAFEALIVAPAPRYAVEDAWIALGTSRVALRSQAHVDAAPLLVAPRVALHPARCRVDLAVELDNAGWADARDVALRIALPASLRPLDGSLAVDGIPLVLRAARSAGAREATSREAVARVHVERDALSLVVRRVPPRGSVRVALAAAVPATFDGGVVAVRAETHEVTLACVPERVRELRLRLVDPPATLQPGVAAPVLAELVNAGDRGERITLALRGAVEVTAGDGTAVNVPPAGVAQARFVVRASETLDDGAPIPLVIVASDDEGECAVAEHVAIAHERAWLTLVDLPRRDGQGLVQYCVRNVGTSTARNVALVAAADERRVEPIAPAGEVTLALDERDARHGARLLVGGREALVLPPLVARVPAAVAAQLAVSETVIAGAPFAVSLLLAFEERCETLTLCVAPQDGLTYVAGSTSLDGRALLDGTAGAPLAAGIVLREIPAGTRIVARWCVVADALRAGDAIALGAELVVDGETRPVAPLVVTPQPGGAFATRPYGFAYHLDARTLPAPHAAEAPEAIVLDEPIVVAEPVAETDDDVVLGLRLDRARSDEIVRLLRGGGDALVAHVLALRALFPDLAGNDDSAERGVLDDARAALVDLFDRLYVKLRIPGFTAGIEDLEDAHLRAALVALVARLKEARTTDGTDRPDVATRRISRSRIAELAAALDEAPYGDPAVLRVLAALVPDRCDGDPALGAALARYAALLAGALAAVPPHPDAAEMALAAGAGAALDDARSALLRALGAPRSLVGAA
jgi:hypothetical protein